MNETESLYAGQKRNYSSSNFAVKREGLLQYFDFQCVLLHFFMQMVHMFFQMDDFHSHGSVLQALTWWSGVSKVEGSNVGGSF